MTQEQLSALLVSHENDWQEDLEEFLGARQICFDHAQSFEEVENALNHAHPDVIITAANLPDGTWRDIADLVQKTPAPTSIVVVAEREESRPYLSAAINWGVFEFLHPPFDSEMQACVIQVAARDTRRRREEWALESLNWMTSRRSRVRNRFQS